MNLTGIKLRRELLEKYQERHNGREAYDRVKTRQNIKSYTRQAMSIILEEFYNNAPVETGYGRSAGIRYKRDSSNLFHIIVGSEKNARSGQINNAPYMAIQNVWDYNQGWIQDAIRSAKNKLRKYGIHIIIDNPHIISNYITKSGSAPPSGYSIKVFFHII